MTFATPVALLALVFVPLLLAAYLLIQRRRIKYALRFTNLPLLVNVVDRAPRWRRHLPPLVVLAALATLIVGVARPQVAIAQPRKEGTVILAIDRSGSMLATDVTPSRMAAARAAAATFIRGLPSGFKVGLVSFSDQADVVLPPTSDHEEAVKALATLQADNGTALGDAITRSVDLGLTNRSTTTETSGTPLVVLLLSDGANTTGDANTTGSSRERRRVEGPRVHRRARYATPERSRPPRPTGRASSTAFPPDPATLAAVAEKTGGKFFEAPDASVARDRLQQDRVPGRNRDRRA